MNLPTPTGLPQGYTAALLPQVSGATLTVCDHRRLFSARRSRPHGFTPGELHVAVRECVDEIWQAGLEATR